VSDGMIEREEERPDIRANLMTLGGLALAVGILIDEATVEVENIHSQMEKTPSVALAVRRG
jgi:Cu/Ag efflux pump CusA